MGTIDGAHSVLDTRDGTWGAWLCARPRPFAAEAWIFYLDVTCRATYSYKGAKPADGLPERVKPPDGYQGRPSHEYLLGVSPDS